MFENRAGRFLWMMDVLKDWLDSTVAREFNAAVQWRERTPSDVRLSDNGQYEDDGSNLRAKSSKTGVVQITKLVTNDEPIEAWITDSTTRLKATMATSAIQKLFTESRKRVNKGILGGLIHILAFEVVATHLGPRDSRLTILIKEFKSLGSEGSSNFAVPRPIEQNLEIKQLCERLKGIRAKENRNNKHLDDSEKDSTVTSQNDLDLSSDESPMTSQQALATQARLTDRQTEKLDRARDSPNHQDSVPVSARLAGVDSSSPVRKQSKSPLGMKTGSPDVVANENVASRIQPARHTLEKSSRATANEVKKPNNVAGLLSLIPTLLPKGKLRKSMMHPKLSPENMVTAGKNVPERENLKDEEHVVEPPSVVDQSNGSSNAVEQEALVKEKGLPQTEENDCGLASENLNPVGTLDSRKESAVIDNADLTLAQVSNRISEREVRIAKDQQSLLDQSDSWVPAEPGKNAPIINVPIEALKAMDRLADSRAERLSKLTQKHEELNTIQSRHSSVISESANDSKSESDPGTSVSWSPSPNAREKLPPNSSPIPLNEFQEETEDEAFQLEKRSLSESSNSVASVRRNPARARKKPKLAEKVTPSPVSASKPFPCPINGCKKSYKLLYHMKHHTEKHHGGAGSVQTTSQIDKADSEIPPKSALTWFACSKCHSRFNSPLDVLEHERKSECSLESQGNFAKTSSREALMNTADYRGSEISPQLISPARNNKGSSKSGPRQRKAGKSVAPPPVEHQIPNSPGILPSETEPVDDTLQGTSPKKKSAIQNDVQKEPIRFLHSDETGLSVGRQATLMADTELSDFESNSQASNPHAIQKASHLNPGNALTRSFPSTASQSEEPVLQVKRTPYANGHKYNVRSQMVRPYGSPSGKYPPLSASTIYDKNATGYTSQEPFVFGTSSAEPHSTKPTENSSVGSDGGQTGPQGNPGNLDEEFIARQVQRAIDSLSQTRSNKGYVPEESLGDIEPSNLSGTENLGNHALVVPKSVSSIEKDRESRESEERKGRKRKSSDTQLISPDVTKRQRKSKSPEPAQFTRGEQAMPDPSISGRLWRQEHFASRKDFMATPKEEDQMHLSPKDRVSSPSSQSQDQASRIISQADFVSIKGEVRDPALDLRYTSPSAIPQRGLELSRSIAPVEPPKLNFITTAVASNERLHHQQRELQAADSEQSDIALLDADSRDKGETREKKPQNTAQNIGIEGIQTSPKPTIFDRFKISYPDYSGNIEQFINICNKIRNLVEVGREEHQTLWDDFIVRYYTEYPTYINQCVNMAEDPVPYEQFYRNEIIEARYNKLVVTRKTLNEALNLKDHLLRSARPQHPKNTTQDGHVSASVGTRTQPDSVKGSFGVSRQRSPLTVDLTGENEYSSIVQRPNPLPGPEMKPPHRPPWIGFDKPNGAIPRSILSPSHVPLSNDHSKAQSQLGQPSGLTSTSSWDSLTSNSAKIAPSSALSKRPLSDTFQTISEPSVPVRPNLTMGGKAEVTTGRIMSDATQEENRSNSADDWRKDENSPFSSFARAYLAIEPGKGNSYAKTESTSTEPKHEGIGSAGGSSARLKQLDIFNWYL